MNEIEAKRKELENRILHLRARYMFDLSKKKEEELKGFNLGVEMARKEILDKLYEFKNNEREGLNKLPEKIAIQSQSGWLMGYANLWTKIYNWLESLEEKK